VFVGASGVCPSAAPSGPESPPCRCAFRDFEYIGGPKIPRDPRGLYVSPLLPHRVLLILLFLLPPPHSSRAKYRDVVMHCNPSLTIYEYGLTKAAPWPPNSPFGRPFSQCLRVGYRAPKCVAPSKVLGEDCNCTLASFVCSAIGFVQSMVHHQMHQDLIPSPPRVQKCRGKWFPVRCLCTVVHGLVCGCLTQGVHSTTQQKPEHIFTVTTDCKLHMLDKRYSSTHCTGPCDLSKRFGPGGQRASPRVEKPCFLREIDFCLTTPPVLVDAWHYGCVLCVVCVCVCVPCVLCARSGAMPQRCTCFHTVPCSLLWRLNHRHLLHGTVPGRSGGGRAEAPEGSDTHAQLSGIRASHRGSEKWGNGGKWGIVSDCQKYILGNVEKVREFD